MLWQDTSWNMIKSLGQGLKVVVTTAFIEKVAET